MYGYPCMCSQYNTDHMPYYDQAPHYNSKDMLVTFFAGKGSNRIYRTQRLRIFPWTRGLDLSDRVCGPASSERLETPLMPPSGRR